MSSSSSLASLPPSCLVEALSFVTHRSDSLAWFGAVCRAVHETLQQQAAWQHLCRRYWFATEERLRDWPALSARALYMALEQWTPFEGYYVLAPQFPWGLLVLLQLSGGQVRADVVRFLPHSRGLGGFEEVRVPLFRVSLTEDSSGAVRSTVDAGWLRGAAAEISRLEPEELYASSMEANLFFRDLRIVQAGLFSTRRALRVAAAAAAEEEDVSTSPDAKRAHPAWPGSLPGTEEELTARTESMLQWLLGERVAACDLALVRGPEDFVPQDERMPWLRPGLYAGDYGHEDYGQFRVEVLLLEYVSLTWEELVAEVREPSRLFARPPGCHNTGAPAELQEYVRQHEIAGEITFMRGVKQCGDLHVPMGATTFVALCGPPEVCAALAEQRGAVPTRALNRQTQREEPVLQSWRGLGTLALPGFKRPSWSGGWLLQLPRDPGTEEHRYGFMWDRAQDVVALHWVTAQDSSPFLQRAWLPQDLQ